MSKALVINKILHEKFLKNLSGGVEFEWHVTPIKDTNYTHIKSAVRARS